MTTMIDGAAFKVYEGSKRLKAWPLTLGDYNAYRGWAMPSGEDPNSAGYLVEYLPVPGENPTPNHPNHQYYISWSPAPVFEAVYREIDPTAPDDDAPEWGDAEFARATAIPAGTPDLLARVMVERDGLARKLEALRTWLEQPDQAVDAYVAELLGIQQGYMTGYLAVLSERIRYANDPNGTPLTIQSGSDKIEG